jgi:hypothetical protein
MTTWNLGETVTALISMAELLHDVLIDARSRCQGEVMVSCLRTALLNGSGEAKSFFNQSPRCCCGGRGGIKVLFGKQS